MRRAGLAALLIACALVGALLSVAVTEPSPASTGTTAEPVVDPTASNTTDTTDTTGTETTPTTPTTPPPPSVIPDGVNVGGVLVGGLAPSVALSVVRTAYSAPLVIVFDGRTLQPTPASLGVVVYAQNAVNRALTAAPGTDVPLLVRVRGERVRAYVARLAKRFDRRPVDSRLLLRRLRPFVTKDRPGRALDRTAATEAIVDAFKNGERFPVELQARPVRPSVTRKTIGPVIVIRRGSNRLFLYEGMRLRRWFGVATGQTAYPTPLGRFSIVVKWKNPWWYPPDSDWARGQSPIPPGPGNPLGTRWMGLSARGVGIHGTPDAASIGYSVSHGCIRMQIPEAEWVFNHVDVGTTVFIVAA